MTTSEEKGQIKPQIKPSLELNAVGYPSQRSA